MSQFIKIQNRCSIPNWNWLYTLGGGFHFDSILLWFWYTYTQKYTHIHSHMNTHIHSDTHTYSYPNRRHLCDDNAVVAFQLKGANTFAHNIKLCVHSVCCVCVSSCFQYNENEKNNRHYTKISTKNSVTQLTIKSDFDIPFHTISFCSIAQWFSFFSPSTVTHIIYVEFHCRKVSVSKSNLCTYPHTYTKKNGICVWAAACVLW